jgi:predicted acetyltransferase
MMDEANLLRLPRELDSNLLLRWGRPEDADELAAFNIRLHTDDPSTPEKWLGAWTRDLISGVHPTTSAENFTIVEDRQSGAIVSSQVLIPQTWFYEDIPFTVGRPELIATDEAYRRRGLIREQMGVAHAQSAQLGHMVQAITGIPWFYRRFGYEMAINLGGGRDYFWVRSGNDKPLDEETYEIRPAGMADISLLDELYKIHGANSLLTRLRTEPIWQFELQTANRQSIAFLNAHIISDQNGRDVAYVTIQYSETGSAFFVSEVGVLPGHSWRSVALFITRELKRRADELNKNREKPITNIRFIFDDNHPLVAALDGQLEKRLNPYAWYIRVPDLHRFMDHIIPVLERRLAGSVVAGHTGTLRLNFFTDTLKITLKEGKIAEIGRYEPDDVEDADATFPGLSFLQLLFGYHSFEELDEALPDCFARHAEARVLLHALFPKRPSYIDALY